MVSLHRPLSAPHPQSLIVLLSIPLSLPPDPIYCNLTMLPTSIPLSHHNYVHIPVLHPHIAFRFNVLWLVQCQHTQAQSVCVAFVLLDRMQILSHLVLVSVHHSASILCV